MGCDNTVSESLITMVKGLWLFIFSIASSMIAYCSSIEPVLRSVNNRQRAVRLDSWMWVTRGVLSSSLDSLLPSSAHWIRFHSQACRVSVLKFNTTRFPDSRRTIIMIRWQISITAPRRILMSIVPLSKVLPFSGQS